MDSLARHHVGHGDPGSMDLHANLACFGLWYFLLDQPQFIGSTVSEDHDALMFHDSLL
jgi:hypothetical protein